MSLKKDERGYYARVYTAGRGSRRVQRVFGHVPLREAKKLYTEFMVEVLGAEDATNRPTLSRVTASYLEASRNTLKPRSLHVIKDIYLNKHWVPFFGDIAAETLTPMLIEQYRTHRLEQKIGSKGRMVSNGTVNREVDTLNSVLNKAVTLELIVRNPVGGKRVKALPETSRIAFFSPDEWERFTAALLDTGSLLTRAEGQSRLQVQKHRDFYLGNYRNALPLFQTMLMTCSRLTEITKLNWFDVDLNRKKITIHQHKTKEDKTLDIAPGLQEIFQTLHKSSEGHGLVFKRQDGSEWEGEYLDRVFKTALNIAGIQKPYTIHTIRHTGASWMVQKGVPIFEVSKVLGHTNIQTTMRYSHLAPNQLVTAMNAISDTVKTLENVATETVAPILLAAKDRM